jgi:hypothetical protein
MPCYPAMRFLLMSSALDTLPLGGGSRRPGIQTSRSQEDTGLGHGMVIFRSKTEAGVEVDVATHVHIEDDGVLKRPELSV